MKKRRQFLQLLLIAVVLFSTITACDKTDATEGETPETVKDADGNKYNTVSIGSQVWMVENLKTTKYNDGSPISNKIDGIEWHSLTIGAYCNYDNLESNATTYGRLYNWYAVNTGKLAPAGWHVPTDEDWTILENYLIANGYNYDSTKDVDKIAKSLCAKTNWSFSEYTGTPGAAPANNNSSGFTALPGGMRFGIGGVYLGIEWYSHWWSSNEFDETYAYTRLVESRDGDFDKGSYYKSYGLSVRLVKD